MHLLLAAWLMAEACGTTCTNSAWELYVGGSLVTGLGDMTEEECTSAKDEFDNQVPAFTPTECVETGIKREEM
jgi:hypothetical protein